MDVTIERDSVDQYGDPVPGNSHVEHDVIWWPFIPKQPSTHEDTLGQDYTLTNTVRQFSFQPDADVKGSDTIVAPDGSRWHVIGVPMPWENPFTGDTPGKIVEGEMIS